jgi:hypothetical protein
VIQLIHAPLCADCRTATHGHVQQVCQFVLEHPGLVLEEVARQCKLSLKDMEEMLFSGRLGAAAAYILFKCQSCHIKMSAEQRKGRFCPECANKIETQVIQLEREAAFQKEKPKPLHRGTDRKDDSGKLPAEVAGTGTELAHPVEAKGDTKPKPAASAEPKSVAGYPEGPAKQESARPVSDSYGFKRVTDV